MTVWIVVAVLLLLSVFAIFDTFWPLTVAFLLGGAVVWWLERLPAAWAYVRVWHLAAYVAIAFAWVFFRWVRLVEDELDSARMDGRKEPRPPKWSSHSYDFAAYFFWWPFDLVAFVVRDLVIDIWEAVSKMVSRTFDRYAEWRFKSGASKEA